VNECDIVTLISLYAALFSVASGVIRVRAVRLMITSGVQRFTQLLQLHA